MNFAILLECEICGARWVVGAVPPTIANGCPECRPGDYLEASESSSPAVSAILARQRQIGRGERFIDGRIRLANPGRPC